MPTASDFGKLGEPPSHPELLDWLAQRFVADGWSIKKMHRLMVTSMTYRQAATSDGSQAALSKDPDNRLWWKMTTRRLDAEQIRDAILAATGKLDLAVGGPSVDAKEPRRSIYTKCAATRATPLLERLRHARRLHQHRPAQRDHHADASAAHVQQPVHARPGQGLRRPARRVSSRPIRSSAPTVLPSAGRHHRRKSRRPTISVKEQTRRVARPGGRRPHTALVDFCHVLLNANEFLYVD